MRTSVALMDVSAARRMVVLRDASSSLMPVNATGPVIRERFPLLPDPVTDDSSVEVTDAGNLRFSALRFVPYFSLSVTVAGGEDAGGEVWGGGSAMLVRSPSSTSMPLS